VEPLSVIIDVSDPPYSHKMSPYLLLKTNKILVVKKTNKAGCTVVCR